MMRTTIRAAYAMLAVLAVVAAAAEAGNPMPRYDVAAYCGKVSEVVGKSRQTYDYCIRKEQEAYDGLKAHWAKVPGTVRARCDEIGRAGGGSYATLDRCVRKELDAAGGPPVFEF
jgi:hypothetical protein